MSSVPAESREHGSNTGPASESIRVEHGDRGPSPSRAVIEVVAGAAGVEPVDLADEAGIVLYDHVDLDALDALVAGRPESDIDISVSVAGYEVTVDATAAVAERAQ